MRRVWAQTAQQFAVAASASVERVVRVRLPVDLVLASACGCRFPDRRMDMPHRCADSGDGAGRAVVSLHATAIAAQEPGEGDSGGGYCVSVLHDTAGDGIWDAVVVPGVRGGAVLDRVAVCGVNACYLSTARR